MTNAKVRYLLLNEGRYYAQVAVPTDLRHHYKQRTIKRALNTADRVTANQRIYRAVAEIKAEFESKRGIPDRMPTDPLDSEGRKAWLTRMQAKVRDMTQAEVITRYVMPKFTPTSHVTVAQVRKWLADALHHAEALEVCTGLQNWSGIGGDRRPITSHP
jgi:truncated hemoglobin YjbI